MSLYNQSLQTTAILAMSADGKIADAQRSAARFSSANDLAHLEATIATADGVLFGGSTLRAYGTTLPIRNPNLLAQRQQRGQPPQPLQTVWSVSGQFDPRIRFFQQPGPRALMTSAEGARRWQDQTAFDQIWELPPTADGWDWGTGIAYLKKNGIHKLVLLGGGRLIGEWMRHNLVNELLLTLCPLILGGSQAPTPVDGPGFTLTTAPQLELLSSQVVDQEVYLHYRVLPNASPSEFQ